MKVALVCGARPNLAKAEIRAPSINPIISGRRYCTTLARCNPSPPAMSRMKQATHTPMFAGLPYFVIRAAITPKVNPTRIIRVLGDQNRLKVDSFPS